MTRTETLSLSTIVAELPEQWQRVYQLVNIQGFSKAKTAKIIGISDVRVGQLIRKINAKIAEDDELKKYFR